MYLNMLWEWIAENSKWFFSGAGNIFLEKILNIKYFEKDSQLIYANDTQENNIVSETIQEEKEEDSYAELLGKRHKHLRENYLELSERKMATFYGYKKVKELETYEKGEDEFPLESIAKLEQTFLINSKYLEEGNSFIFRPFELEFHQENDEATKLLEEGFRPYFLCCSENRHDLLTRVVLHKWDPKYSRTVVASGLSSFASPGGGFWNIYLIIKKMIERRMKYNDAIIVKVDNSTWEPLNEGRFYSKSMCFGLGRDEECYDIFEKGYRKLEEEFLASNF